MLDSIYDPANHQLIPIVLHIAYIYIDCMNVCKQHLNAQQVKTAQLTIG